MSATGTRGRRPTHDFYETPSWCIDEILSRVELPRGPVADMGCGTGAIAERLLRRGHTVIGVERDIDLLAKCATRLRPWSTQLELRSGDAIGLLAAPLEGAQAVVMNPPYRYAAEFIDRALTLVPDGGLVVVHTRQTFTGSCRQRRHLFDGGGLCVTWDLTRRPSYCLTTSCRACGGVWRWHPETKLANALHPQVHNDAGDPVCTEVGEQAGQRGADGKLRPYRYSRVDNADACWLVWRRGYRGPVTRGWIW